MKNQARHFSRLRRAAYIFILPMFAGLLLFSVIPFVQNILYSFRRMGTFGEGTFIGLKNYQDLLTDDTFWLALRNTAFYAVVGVPLVIIFSIFLAHQINKKIRGRTIYRTLLFIPAVIVLNRLWGLTGVIAAQPVVEGLLCMICLALYAHELRAERGTRGKRGEQETQEAFTRVQPQN